MTSSSWFCFDDFSVPVRVKEFETDIFVLRLKKVLTLFVIFQFVFILLNHLKLNWLRKSTWVENSIRWIFIIAGVGGCKLRYKPLFYINHLLSVTKYLNEWLPSSWSKACFTLWSSRWHTNFCRFVVYIALKRKFYIWLYERGFIKTMNELHSKRLEKDVASVWMNI